ncbi:MAG: PHP domain-containing protein [Treponema sp.]|nr:PHP domain-containing protein [Treponema sp.]
MTAITPGSQTGAPLIGPIISDPVINDPVINDPTAGEDYRISALSAFIKKNAEKETSALPSFCGEINNHIHTIYSFSPYTPAMAALRARLAGLEAAGSVDHDSYAAAGEMRRACAVLGMGCVTGLEIRVSLRHTEFGSRKINSPDSAGIIYITIQGVPAAGVSAVNDFLAPIKMARGKRNRLMVENLNNILAGSGISPLSYQNDIVPLSMEPHGGSVTERHILYALSLKLINDCGRGENLLRFLKEKFSLEATGKIKSMLEDKDNPYYPWDLLGLLKSSFNDRIFIQPDEAECPQAEKAAAFAASINAVPSYAYLGDITESPTGDKKAEKFEDEFLDILIPFLKKLGFLGITYMPPRNTAAQLERLHSLCVKYGFLEISGVDINSPRQTFSCPEIRRPEFAILSDTTWALAAHELLANRTPPAETRGLFNPADPLAARPLEERIAAFAKIGRDLAAKK